MSVEFKNGMCDVLNQLMLDIVIDKTDDKETEFSITVEGEEENYYLDIYVLSDGVTFQQDLFNLGQQYYKYDDSASVETNINDCKKGLKQLIESMIETFNKEVIAPINRRFDGQDILEVIENYNTEQMNKLDQELYKTAPNINNQNSIVCMYLNQCKILETLNGIIEVLK